MGLFGIIVIAFVVFATGLGFVKLGTEIKELFKSKIAYKIGVILSGLLLVASLVLLTGFLSILDIADSGKATILAISAFIFYGVTFIPASQRKLDKEDNIQEKL